MDWFVCVLFNTRNNTSPILETNKRIGMTNEIKYRYWHIVVNFSTINGNGFATFAHQDTQFPTLEEFNELATKFLKTKGMVEPITHMAVMPLELSSEDFNAMYKNHMKK